MSLDWSFSKTPDQQNLVWDENGKMTTTAEALVWAAMLIDIGTIRKNNIDEWHFRIQFLKSIGVTWIEVWNNAEYEGSKPFYPTYDDIADHIGLRTNVSTIARLKWVRRIMRQHENRVQQDVTREIEARGDQS